MSDKSQQFQRKWGFRRNDSDLDSSDDQSQPSSACEPKLGKQKLATRASLNENDQQASRSPQSHPGGENHPSFEEPNREAKKSYKKPERKPRTKTDSREAFNHESSDATLDHLRGYMESLVEGVKVTRGELLKWMNNEMEKWKDDVTSSKPSVTRKGQRQARRETQNLKRTKIQRNSPNKARKKAGTRNLKHEHDPSEELSKDGKTSNQTNEDVLPQKEPQNTVSDKTLIDKNEKHKRKRPSTKKEKVALGDQPPKKSSAPAALASTASPTPGANYLTLPTVVPQKEVESIDKTHSEDRSERDTGTRNILNPTSSLSSQLNSTPRSLQIEEMFAQNGLRYVSDYEQHMVPTTQNIQGTPKGNGFPFQLPYLSQESRISGLNANGGLGMPNIFSQFGLPYLSQESRISTLNTNGGLPRMPSRNHPFVENYCALNQQMSFNAQGGVAAIPSPDNSRVTNMQPR